MPLLLIASRRVLLFLVLVQSASLYKIYASNDNRPNLSSHSLSSSIDEDISQELSNTNRLGDDDDVDEDALINSNNDEDTEYIPSWLSLASSEMKQQQQQPLRKRSTSIKLHSAKTLPQRRNYRPHWNPLVAAYRRCGELSTREERESCFKNAIQMLFVHKL